MSSCIFNPNRWHANTNYICFLLTFKFFNFKAVSGMARPEMERRAGDRNPGAPNSCRMEVLRQDAWPCHRHRTIATQISTVLPPLTQVPTQDAFSSDSVPQQDIPLRDNTGKVLQHRDSCLCVISIMYFNEIQKIKSLALTPRVKMHQEVPSSPP